MAYEGDADGLPQPTPQPDGARSSDGISGKMAGWFGIALTILALVALVVISSFSTKDSLGYAALTGTAILSIGLISLIALSRAVGVIEPAAALGLPHGSIRALLALGLAIVFVSVASWILGGLFSPIGLLVTEGTVYSDSERNNYWERYPASDYIVRESASQKLKPQAAAAESPPAGAPDAATKDAAKNAASFPKDLQVYLRRPGADQGQLDLAKQILTISATVLVTIVGFYFGSNGSADAARSVGAIMSGSATTPAGSGAAKTVPASNDDLSKLSSAIAAVSAGCSSRLQGLGADPMGLLRQAVSGANADAELTRKLGAAEQLYADLKAKSAACDVDAARAKETIDGLPSSPSQPQIQQASERLKQLKADTEQVNQEFEQKLAQYSDARQYILQKTAKG
jgi:hypothetical protein